jgi:hypothetical protein
MVIFLSSGLIIAKVRDAERIRAAIPEKRGVTIPRRV